MKNAIVLSGGGARGFAHLGVLQAFEDYNIAISAVSGTSAGALVGALYANGLKPKQIYDLILEKKLTQNLSFSWSKMGLFSFAKVEKLLLQYIPHNSFEGLQMPLYVCATNLQQGQERIFSTGELIGPVLASCAIPGIFSPVKIEGKAYIDGGVINNLPLEPLDKSKYKIIGVNILPVERNMPVGSAKDILLKCLLISIGEKSALKEHLFDVLIKPRRISSFSGFNLKAAKELYDLGYKSAIDSLEKADFLKNSA
jgi:NTE family protein